MDTPYSLTLADEVVSTQDEARRRAVDELAAVVIAHRQTGGRGRSGARWENATRAVAVSYAWRGWRGRQLPVSLLGGVAARRVLGSRVSLKWPNDVLVDERKVAGILVEADPEVVVVGMGLNLYWPNPPAGAGAYCDDDPGPDLGPHLARRWVDTLHDLLDSGGWPRHEYLASCATIGSWVTWEPGGRGRALGVEEDGRLVVEGDDGEIRCLASGAIRHLRHRPSRP